MAHTLSNLIQNGQFKILFVSNLKSVKKNQFKLWRFLIMIIKIRQAKIQITYNNKIKTQTTTIINFKDKGRNHVSNNFGSFDVFSLFELVDLAEFCAEES